MRYVSLSRLLCFALATTSAWAWSQNYPGKSIRVVTSEAGGGTDFIARQLAQGIAGPLGQAVIVDNRVAQIAAETAVKALPDGYTLLFIGNPFWILPLMRANLPYDPVRDFAPVIMAVSSPNILVTHPSLGVKSVKELIAVAKAKPGELNYGSGGPGSSPHLAAEMLKSMTGISIVHVPYKGAGPALNALLGGQLQLMFPNAAAARPHLKSGKLTVLAITSLKPSAIYPELPTLAASGVPGYESAARQGFFVPAKAPAAVIDRLNREVANVLSTADIRERFINIGSEPVGGSPRDFADAIRSEMIRVGKVIKEAGIKSD